MNPDNHYGLQCVDLVDQYAQDIFGVSWTVCVGGVAGAKALLDRVPDEFWIRTDNNPNDPNLVPSKGDVVVFSGSAINQWGHTAVVESADVNGMWVVQQDGFAAPLIWADGNWYSGKPAHRIWLGYTSNGTGPLAGWLTPKTHKLAQQDTPPAPELAANQRVTATTAKKRSEPKVADNVLESFEADRVLTFKGFVRGENVSGNDIWFVGISGAYLWSGNFVDHSTNGLEDLTPAPAPVEEPVAANQRITASKVNKRSAPKVSPDNILGSFEADLILTFNGYVHGQSVDGNDIWFVGISGAYLWSGAFTDPSTNGLPNLSPTSGETTSVPTVPTPEPVEEVYNFVADFDFVEKIPANINNVQRAVDNPGKVVFPENPTHNVIHQFGTLGRDTVGSTINQFTNPNLGEGAASAHFVISGKRIIQMVSLKDRAYHAYSVGNNYVGIETDPAQDADTIASTQKLLKALNAKYGYKLTLIRHKDVPKCITSCGTLIDLAKYEVAYPEPTPVPTPDPIVQEPAPEPEPEVIVPEDVRAKIISDFQKWQLEQYLKV